MLSFCNKKRKGSAVGILLITAALVVYLAIPLAKGAFEMVYYAHIRNRALAMTDEAVFSLLADMDAEAYSEGRVVLSVESLRSRLHDAAGIIEVKNISLEMVGGQATIIFDFNYPQVFSERMGELKMKARYDFEMLAGPAY